MREKLPNLPIIHANLWKKNTKTRILVTGQNQLLLSIYRLFSTNREIQMSVMSI